MRTLLAKRQMHTLLALGHIHTFHKPYPHIQSPSTSKCISINMGRVQVGCAALAHSVTLAFIRNVALFGMGAYGICDMMHDIHVMWPKRKGDRDKSDRDKSGETMCMQHGNAYATRQCPCNTIPAFALSLNQKIYTSSAKISPVITGLIFAEEDRFLKTNFG